MMSLVGSFLSSMLEVLFLLLITGDLSATELVLVSGNTLQIAVVRFSLERSVSASIHYP
jgi:hypothetical protein